MIKIEILFYSIKNDYKINNMDLSLLISTIVMLKQSVLKDTDYLFKVMIKLNKLLIQNNFNESIKYHLDEDINIILKNVDDWIRHYNSEIRMSMKRELMTNLEKIKKMFQKLSVS